MIMTDNNKIIKNDRLDHILSLYIATLSISRDKKVCQKQVQGNTGQGFIIC